MGSTFIAKCEFQLPDDVMSPPYKKIVLKNFPLLDAKGQGTTGTIWLELSREPFEGNSLGLLGSTWVYLDLLGTPPLLIFPL